MKNVIKHKIPTSHEEWLENRFKGIGGSDAGAILGLNPYKSPYALWCEKTGRIHNDVDNEAMRIGRDLEDYVAKRFCEETGKKVKKSNYSYQSKKYPFMLANVDRLVSGEDAILECKTTNMLTKTKYDKGDIPASYYAQCMHYMAVTGCRKAYIAILVLGKGFYYFEVNRDEEEIQSLIESEEAFWEDVQSDTEPEVDGSSSTSDALDGMYSNSVNNEAIELFGMESKVAQYVDINSRIKTLEKEKKSLENELKHDLGECENGYTDSFYVTWKSVSSSRLDSKLVKEKYPEVYTECLKESTSRRFGIKEIK